MVEPLVLALPQELAVGEKVDQHDQEHHLDDIQRPAQQRTTVFCRVFPAGPAEIEFHQERPQENALLQSPQSNCQQIGPNHAVLQLPFGQGQARKRHQYLVTEGHRPQPHFLPPPQSQGGQLHLQKFFHQSLRKRQDKKARPGLIFSTLMIVRLGLGQFVCAYNYNTKWKLLERRAGRRW